MEKFFAHGKFLVSAEYAILHGAQGLAIPLKKGQSLTFEKVKKERNDAHITWTAFDQNNYPWLEVTFKKEDKSIVKTNYIGAAKTLQTLLNLVPTIFFKEEVDYKFETYLQFDKTWGWGSSSTLVSLISQCTGANPYELYRATFNGSGFDLACATANGPITYYLDHHGNPTYEGVSFSPGFKDDIYFVYLGKKQSSLKSIMNRPAPDLDLIEKVNLLTQQLIQEQNNKTKFCALINQHELLLSSYLNKKPIKDLLFKDSDLTIKSLGAWGGDFVLAVGASDEITSLKTKGYPIIFKWDEVVL